MISRTPRTRPTLAGRLSRLMESRGKEVPQEATPMSLPMDGTIARLGGDVEPLSVVLGRARSVARAPRSMEYMHVSDLIGKCVRKIALVERSQTALAPQSLSYTDALTFAQGEAIHTVIKQRAAIASPSEVWGKWSCLCGTKITKEPCLLSQAPKENCPACRTPVDRYREAEIRDKEYMITGSPDLILYAPRLRALHVTELKSISHEAWKELLRPQPDHILQTVFYWHLLHRKGYRLTDRVSILYATKGWMFSGSPFKEFTVSPQENVHRLEPLIADALAIKEARKGGNLPVRTCVSLQVPDAKKCEVCNICFGASSANVVKVSVKSASRR